MRIQLQHRGLRCVAVVAEPALTQLHADVISRWYNAPANARLLGNTEPMSAEDVVEHYANTTASGGTNFLLLCDGQLVGDADFRNCAAIDGENVCEFAFLIGESSGVLGQGKGLGTAFATMLAQYAFSYCNMAQLFASVAPDNHASLRVFEKLGYRVVTDGIRDRFAEVATDVVLSLTPTWLHCAVGEVAITVDQEVSPE